MAFSVKQWLDRFGSGGSFDQPTDTGDVPDTPADAAGMRDLETRLSAYTDTVGATKQPLDSDLTAIAALTTTTFGRSLLALADAAAGRTALGLGTAATSASTAFDASGAAAAAQAASQPLDSDLTAIAALTTTTFGRALLALADAAAGRTAFGLGTASTAALDTDITLATNSDTRVPSQKAIKAYADGLVASGAADASTSTKGVTRLSKAPASAAIPIALGVNDERVQPQITGNGTSNFGATLTVDFASIAQELVQPGIRTANLAVTVNNPVAGSRLRMWGPTDGLGNWTLTVAGQPVTVPFSTTQPMDVYLLWFDATHFGVVSAGVYTESDPNAVLKSLGTTKGDLIAFTASGTPARQAVGTDGYAVVADSSQTNGVKYAARPIVTVAYKTGTLATATGTSRLPIMEAAAIIDVRAMVNTAPTGATLIVDVNKNGTTVFTTQGNRPTVAISGTASSAAVPDVTTLAAGDYLTVDIDQVGSTIAGADLTVAVRYRPTA